MKKTVFSLLLFLAAIKAFIGYTIFSNNPDSEDVVVCMLITISAFIFVIIAAFISIWYKSDSAKCIDKEVEMILEGIEPK